MAYGFRQRVVLAHFLRSTIGCRETIVVPPRSVSFQLRDFYEAHSWAPRRFDFKRGALFPAGGMEDNITAINSFKPDFIYGFGSYIGALFRLAHERRLPMHRPKLILYGADRMADFDRHLIETEVGAPEYHDRVRGAKKAFVRALQGLELFAEMRVPARIVNTVVHPENIRQLEGMVEIIRNSAATSWRLTPVCNVGRAEGASGYDLSKAQLSRLVDFIKEHRNAVNVDFGESHTYLWRLAGAAGLKPFFCGACLTRCSITSEGEVIGCQWISTSLSEGNLQDRSFPQIWKDGFSRFRKNEFQRGCFDCVHFDGCPGGCRAEMKKRGACLKSAWDEGE